MRGCVLGAALALFGAIAAAPGAAQEAEPDVEELRAQTREDILAGYALFERHHPGMHNPFDPTFAQRLKAARDEALERAADATNQADRYLAVQTINNALADGHARLQIAYSGGLGQWAGFHGTWRGDGVYVTYSVENRPRRGDRLLSCDGQPANAVFKRNVFHSGGRPDEAGQWWSLGSGVFKRGALSPQPAMRRCDFVSPDGEKATVDLNWRPFPMEEFDRMFEEMPPTPRVGMERLENGLRWITLSSFNPGPDGIAAYDAIFAELEAQADTLPNDRAIVLDLRRNQGGSSSWSRKIAERLWGADAVAWAMADYFRKTETWHLADQANIDHFAASAERFRANGIDDVADILEGIHHDLSAAKARGETFHKSAFGKELLAEAKPSKPRALPPVYVITDGGCVSACLDGVDTFTRFEGVTLVGASTSADTEYLEIRREKLPSGRGLVILPTKIWVNRPRAPGEVYHPDIPVTDLDWNTEAMTRAILNDLAGERTARAD